MKRYKMIKFMDIDLSYSGTTVAEQIDRLNRLHFVLGYVRGKVDLVGLLALRDYKGCLTATLSGSLSKIDRSTLAYIITEAWEAAGEYAIDFEIGGPGRIEL
jgi:hypothetical protein